MPRMLFIEDSNQESTPWTINAFHIHLYFKHIRDGTLPVDLDAQNTALKHCIQKETLLAEMTYAMGYVSDAQIKQLMSFTPRRLAFYETIACLETEICFDTPEELRTTALTLYREKVKPYCRNVIDALHTITWRDARNKANTALHLYLSAPLLKNHSFLARRAGEIYCHIDARIRNGEYECGLCHAINEASSDEQFIKKITIKILQGEIYNEEIMKVIDLRINLLIQRAIDDRESKFPCFDKSGQKIEGSYKPCKRLPAVKDVTRRHVVIVAGPPACGKGSLVTLAKKYFKEELNVPYRELIKINTDEHRSLVSSRNEMGSNVTLHSSLNNIEASIISYRAIALIKRKHQLGLFHHMLIDGVSPSKSRLSLATYGDSVAHVLVATAPVGVSIKRAFQRGRKTGRFVATRYILSAHQYVSNFILPNLIGCQNSNIKVELFNTNVPQCKMPIKIMELSFPEKKVDIIDSVQVAHFFAKCDINIEATCIDEIYLDSNSVDEQHQSHLSLLRSHGLEVVERVGMESNRSTSGL